MPVSSRAPLRGPAGYSSRRQNAAGSWAAHDSETPDFRWAVAQNAPAMSPPQPPHTNAASPRRVARPPSPEGPRNTRPPSRPRRTPPAVADFGAVWDPAPFAPAPSPPIRDTPVSGQSLPPSLARERPGSDATGLQMELERAVRELSSREAEHAEAMDAVRREYERMLDVRDRELEETRRNSDAHSERIVRRLNDVLAVTRSRLRDIDAEVRAKDLELERRETEADELRQLLRAHGVQHSSRRSPPAARVVLTPRCTASGASAVRAAAAGRFIGASGQRPKSPTTGRDRRPKSPAAVDRRPRSPAAGERRMKGAQQRPRSPAARLRSPRSQRVANWVRSQG
eukprot:TRINITY_DN18825_c0_g1_i1.p1 TRINITY_DN18825_c0_g1~~TRINITY_DN18825_c0_g1_i1.p1  ORF type:complete len:357 (+),score=58.47 TRINITY_DN18825_c0_g1_i1:50-1072(+)